MKKLFTLVIFISFIVYVLVLFALLFFKSGGYWSNLSLIEYIQHSSNIVPLKTISTYLKALSDGSINIDTPIKNLIGNLLMFLPLGFYLPFLTKKFTRLVTYISTVAALIVVIEITQVVTRRGSFDIDDFILNVIGALIGFVICNYTPIRKLFKFRTE